MSEEIKTEGEFKIKRPKKLTSEKTENVKVDLSKPKEDAVQESETTKVVLQDGGGSKEEETETKVELQEVGETHEEKVEEIISEITNEVKEEIKEEVKTPEPVVEQNPLPENIEKLVAFMEETGGTVEDYVRINADYSNVDHDTLLKTYYKQTKPHLNEDEIIFLMQDQFSFDEDVDEERDIKKKKLAAKEEIAKARNFLESLKSKYYDEIKLRPGVTQEQKEAMNFFNTYKENQQKAEEQHSFFQAKTKDFFGEKFKGFEFNLGEKRFRYNVSNPGDLANKQSNLNNLVGKFLDDKGIVSDYDGYHKAMYAAENVDAIANHFYEQGKADATKDIIAKSNNLDNTPRATSNGEVFINGLKVKAISGADGSKLKFKKRT